MRSNGASSPIRVRALRVVTFYLLLLGTWWAVADAGAPDALFPPPGAVFEALRVHLVSGEITGAVAASLQRMAIGYALSIVAGMAVGTLIATSRWADETIGGIVLGVQSLPSITWLPLAVLWFGRDERAIIFVVLMGSAFSIATSARTGILGVPPLLQRAAGTLGASWWQTYAYVVLPGMLPAMVQGMKQGWAFAWRALMAGELLFAMMIVIVIVIVGVTVDRLIFGRAERWVRERWGYAAA
ncbi:MAG: ABC transporter permease subunit [Chloroflexi bacterium]|nr:ABC transporter permease subunit [Chloroflexota bacterium]